MYELSGKFRRELQQCTEDFCKNDAEEHPKKDKYKNPPFRYAR